MSFIDLRFPIGIAVGATGGPVHSTTIVAGSTGYETTNANWADARRRWRINKDILSPALLDELLAWIIVTQGPARAFRFRDPSDWYAGLVWTGDDLVTGTPVQIGTGNGSATAFQLAKIYSIGGGYTRSRAIKRPVAATVKVYLAGVEQSSGWTLNAATGVVTFSSPPTNGAAVAWTGEFDIAARFEADDPQIRMRSVMRAVADGISILEVLE